MRKELTFKDLSPRSDAIYKLGKKLERFGTKLKETKYDNVDDMLGDLTVWQSLEKELQIQQSYFQVEEVYWNS